MQSAHQSLIDSSLPAWLVRRPALPYRGAHNSDSVLHGDLHLLNLQEELLPHLYLLDGSTLHVIAALRHRLRDVGYVRVHDRLQSSHCA